jgi:hypothetical protein
MISQNSTTKHGTALDMSSTAIDRRLRTVGELFRFGMALQTAKRIGPVPVPEPDRKESPDRAARPHDRK